MANRNAEMANQNIYLRRQLRDSLRQKRRELRSSSSSRPPSSVREEEEREEEGEPQIGGSSSEEDSLRHVGEGEGINPTSMTLKLTSRSLKAS